MGLEGEYHLAGKGSGGGGSDAGAVCDLDTDVALGEGYTCAGKGDGALWCWGMNGNGELGDGSTTGSSVPVHIATIDGVAAVSMRDVDTCAIERDKTLWCWGYNGTGQLGDGTTNETHAPIRVGGLDGVVQVSAGFYHTCAVRTDGTLWCWGGNDRGQLGDGTTNEGHVPVQVAALGNGVAQVAAAYEHTCARKTGGTLWCWGGNTHGQLGDGTTNDSPMPVQVAALGHGVAQVALGNGHTCARKIDGTVWCWGDRTYGQVGDGSTSGGGSPVQVSALGNGAAEIATGITHTCARKTDGTLWCWGSNSSGEVGDGTTVDRSLPVKIGALGAEVAKVAAGARHTCARKRDGTLWCWGANEQGQLGDGTTIDKTGPVEVLIEMCH